MKRYLVWQRHTAGGNRWTDWRLLYVGEGEQGFATREEAEQEAAVYRTEYHSDAQKWPELFTVGSGVETAVTEVDLPE